MTSVMNCSDCGATLQDRVGEEPTARTPCVACGSTKRDYRIIAETIHVNLSPFAFQWYAKDFYEAYKNVQSEAKFSPARLTLLAQAIELAGKSLHVHSGKRHEDLLHIGHDLSMACDSTLLSKYGISITITESAELTKFSDLNKAKAFEYFWFIPPGMPKRTTNPEHAGLMHAITGREGLPDEAIMERLLVKLLSPNL